MLSLILLVFAFVLFAVAGLVDPAQPWHNRLVCYGLACFALSFVVEGLPKLPLFR